MPDRSAPQRTFHSSRLETISPRGKRPNVVSWTVGPEASAYKAHNAGNTENAPPTSCTYTLVVECSVAIKLRRLRKKNTEGIARFLSPTTRNEPVKNYHSIRYIPNADVYAL